MVERLGTSYEITAPQSESVEELGSEKRSIPAIVDFKRNPQQFFKQRRTYYYENYYDSEKILTAEGEEAIATFLRDKGFNPKVIVDLAQKELLANILNNIVLRHGNFGAEKSTNLFLVRIYMKMIQDIHT